MLAFSKGHQMMTEKNLMVIMQVMGATNVECDDLASIDIRTHLLAHDSMPFLGSLAHGFVCNLLLNMLVCCFV
jgi:hypothetical protein